MSSSALCGNTLTSNDQDNSFFCPNIIDNDDSLYKFSFSVSATLHCALRVHVHNLWMQICASVHACPIIGGCMMLSSNTAV